MKKLIPVFTATAMARLILILFILYNFQAFGQVQNGSGKRPTPSEAQVEWHKMEFYLFFHFGPNTFTNAEWGKGTEPESVFNPKNLDCDQWCRVAKAAGARGVIITAKHHDGFCLWPSNYSRHTVKSSPWKGGKGDVIRELADACQRNGLKMGVYLSPWDRNHPAYGTPAYNDVYANTLTELLTNYGPLFEIWWDGANGEGPNGKKQVYDFHRFEKLVKQYQPNAVIFSDIGPGCRWAGNEEGTAGEPNWCTIDTAGYTRGAGGPPAEILQNGLADGTLWIPAECDVSIRPGWFYHAEEDSKVKSADQLFDIYLKSVGRGANLILNVPPDQSGRISPIDSASLVAFGAKVNGAFAHNLAFKKSCTIAGPTRALPARALVDGDEDTAQLLFIQNSGTDVQIEVDLEEETTFNCVKLMENTKKAGQRIKGFALERYDNGNWVEIMRSKTVGPRKILVFPEVRTTRLRVRILDAFEYANLAEIQIYKIM